MFIESNNNEPETGGLEPLSIAASPANLTPGVELFTVIKLLATFNCDAVVYVIEEEPRTVKFCEITKLPVMLFVKLFTLRDPLSDKPAKFTVFPVPKF